MNIPEQRKNDPVFVLGFPEHDWPIVQAAARERIRKREAVLFDPLPIDERLAESGGLQPYIECELRSLVHDVGRLLQEYGNGTQETIAQLLDPELIAARRRSGAVALLLARQIESAVVANEAAQSLDAELIEFFGSA